MIPACAHFDVGMIPYSPLANGLLTGKHRRGQPPVPGTRLATAAGANADRWLTDRNFDIVEGLEEFASARGVSLLDVVIGGLAAQPQVISVIAGAMSPEQVRANAHAGRWRPSASDLGELDRIAPLDEPALLRLARR